MRSSRSATRALTVPGLSTSGMIRRGWISQKDETAALWTGTTSRGRPLRTGGACVIGKPAGTRAGRERHLAAAASIPLAGHRLSGVLGGRYEPAKPLDFP